MLYPWIRYPIGSTGWTGTVWGEQWDGTVENHNHVSQIDTYVWKVVVKEKDTHHIHRYIGHVNVIR
jgi:hypothetical protein